MRAYVYCFDRALSIDRDEPIIEFDAKDLLAQTTLPRFLIQDKDIETNIILINIVGLLCWLIPLHTLCLRDPFKDIPIDKDVRW